MNANGEARWLTRRLLRRAPRGSVGRWAALGSVWGHLLLLVGLAFARWPPPAPPPPRPPPIRLVLMVRPTAAVSEPSVGLGAPHAGGTSGRHEDLPAVEGAMEPWGEGAADREVLAQAPERVRVVAPSPQDPVEELRRALGLGPIDGSRAPRERTAAAALFGESGEGVSSEVGEDLEAFEEADGLRGSALGAYIDRVEALVFERWRASDLQIHSRAIGLQGDVSVRYTIARDGTVSDLRISRASGLAEIDGLAVRAIPRRLPRLPPDLGLQELKHEITFRYHNPP